MSTRPSWGPDGSLRPHTLELLERLRSLRMRVYLWSAVGGRQDVIERFGLRAYIAGSFKKPFPVVERPAAVLLTRLRRRFGRVICIDDDPEVIHAFGGVQVTPYLDSPEDEGLQQFPRCRLSQEPRHDNMGRYLVEGVDHSLPQHSVALDTLSADYRTPIKVEPSVGLQLATPSLGNSKANLGGNTSASEQSLSS